MIVVTGAVGFIGSALIWKLNQDGHRDIVAVDNLGRDQRWKNVAKHLFSEIIPAGNLATWLRQPEIRGQVKGIFHMGACSSTTERDLDFLIANNLSYSQDLFRFSVEHDVPFVYASSAATYGNGENGYEDDPARLAELRPTNPYGYSKYLFDRWVVNQPKHPSIWAGLKFFNVYGPNEYHKGAQASVVWKSYNEIRGTGTIQLFKSYRTGIAHGEQKRDFVYVKDVAKVALHFLRSANPAANGIYNVGTGVARSFADLGCATFAALGISPPRFEWIEMPTDVRDHYQYFTQADLRRLRENGGYHGSFVSLEEGVRDYVTGYLTKSDPYL